MKNVKSKIALASIVLCGSVALGISSLNAPVASAATLEGFEVKSASLRVPDGEYGAGIRFTLGLGNVALAEGATTGVLMIPTSSLGASDLTVGLDNEDLRTYSDVQWKDLDDGTKEAYLHLYDVPPTQYATSISLRAYVDHDADPATDPIYTDVATASVAQVADWAYNNDANLDETEKASLQGTYLTGTAIYHSEGQVWDETSAIYNQTLTDVGAPERDGYVFAGWWNNAGTHEWDFDTTKVTSMTTNLYAKWVRDYSAAGTDDWNIGETTFTGAAVIRGDNTSGLYQMGDGAKITLGAHSYAGFEATFKTAIDATSEDKYVSFTAKGADASLFTTVIFDTTGTAKTGATKACVTRDAGDGYTTYVFRVAGYAAGKIRITPLGNTTSTGSGSEIIISNCTVGDYGSLRTGEDANTLFFMDVPLGPTLQQIYRKNATNLYAAEYTTEMAYGNERGSYKSTVSLGQSESYHNMVWSQADLNFLSDTDYAVFYLYSTYSKKIFWSFNRMSANTGYEIMPNQWNRIIVSASDLKAATWTLIDTRMYSKESGSYFDLYMSKVVRYTADEVQNLANKGSTDTWMLGSTTFMGAPSINNGPASGSAYLAGVEYKKAYIVDGVLSVTFARTSDPYINLKLANSIEVAANTEMYVTVTMFNYGRLDKLNGYFNSSGSYPLSYVSHTDIGDGYAKVVLKCSAKSAAYTITSVRLDVEDHSDVTMTTQLRIKDIVVGTSY